MSIETFIYLANVSENLSCLMLVFTLVTFLVGGIFCIHAFSEETDNRYKVLTIVLTTFTTLSITSVMLPNRQTMYLMAGASVAKDAINSSTGQKVKQLIDKELDKLIAPKETK
jgi:hypothetical protein